MTSGRPLAQAGAMVGAGVIGGLFVDIDHPYSEISKILWPVSLVWRPVEQGEFRHGRSFLGHITWHRKGEHSFLVHFLLSQLVLLGAAVLAGPALAASLALAYFVGAVTHLLADECNQSGCMLIWPWKRQIRLPTWLSVREASFFGHGLEVIVSLGAVAAITLEGGRLLGVLA